MYKCGNSAEYIQLEKFELAIIIIINIINTTIAIAGRLLGYSDFHLVSSLHYLIAFVSPPPHTARTPLHCFVCVCIDFIIPLYSQPLYFIEAPAAAAEKHTFFASLHSQAQFSPAHHHHHTNTIVVVRSNLFQQRFQISVLSCRYSYLVCFVFRVRPVLRCFPFIYNTTLYTQKPD